MTQSSFSERPEWFTHSALVQNLVTKDGVWSSYHDERIALDSHLDELTHRIA